MSTMEAVRRKIVRLTQIQQHCLYTGRPLDGDSVFLDLGSNCGTFLSEIVGRFGCRCYAVEPVPALFAQLPESENIHKFNCAISGKNGQIDFHLMENQEANSICS